MRRAGECRKWHFIRRDDICVWGGLTRMSNIVVIMRISLRNAKVEWETTFEDFQRRSNLLSDKCFFKHTLRDPFFSDGLLLALKITMMSTSTMRRSNKEKWMDGTQTDAGGGKKVLFFIELWNRSKMVFLIDCASGEIHWFLVFWSSIRFS